MFSQDNLFNDIMTKIFDIVLLSVLWLLCSIPVITIGASTTALYTVMLKMVKNEEGTISRSFFKAFKDNFKKTVPVTLIMLATIVMLVADFYILGRSSQDIASLMYGGCLVFLIIWVVIFTYTYPLMAKFENTVKNTFINAGKIAVTHLWQTAVAAFLNALPVIWLYVSPETFAYIGAIWLFAGMGLVSFINSHMFVGIFEKLITKSPEGEIAEESL